MTAQAGAILNTSSAWDAVDWRTIEDKVRRLQARIVKAVQQKKWNKVKALQHLLTHSASGKLLAVRRVTVNDGRKTPGVDGELWDTPHKKLQGVISLTARGYRPMPMRRIYIPKANGKLRPLGIPTMRDRAMQALYLLSLDPVVETTADQNSYGFGRGEVVRTRLNNVSLRSATKTLAGCSKATSKAASTTLVISGCSTMFP
jgi:RNA-directed DNA polymerase